MSVNPFERWGLDPQADPKALTTAFRALIEKLTDEGAPEEVLAELRDDWEHLTRHPGHRVALALATFQPDPRPSGRPPRGRFGQAAPAPGFRERVDLPSIAHALGMSFDSERSLHPRDLPDLPLSQDPLFHEEDA